MSPCHLSLKLLCRNTIRPKLLQLLWIYDDELRNPTGQNRALRKIEEYDYDNMLGDEGRFAHLSHLVPQVHYAPASTEWVNRLSNM